MAKKQAVDFQKLMELGKKISENIVLCEDGKYRWLYSMSLYRNPTIFLLVWKIFFFVTLGILAFVVILDVIDWGWNMENIAEILQGYALFLLGMTLLVGAGYLIYAFMMGGRYLVLFEMDEKGVNHMQFPAQARKAGLVSGATVVAGLLAGNVTTVGVGLTSARSTLYSDFSGVRSVKAYPRSHVIKVNGLLVHNQVYAAAEDFDFVLGFITSHCEKLKQ
jgi:hypothetical protein